MNHEVLFLLYTVTVVTQNKLYMDENKKTVLVHILFLQYHSRVVK